MNKGHQLGKIAELYAQQFFARKGYQLLAKNYRYRKAEVDLIVRKNNNSFVWQWISLHKQFQKQWNCASTYCVSTNQTTNGRWIT